MDCSVAVMRLTSQKIFGNRYVRRMDQMVVGGKGFVSILVSSVKNVSSNGRNATSRALVS